MNARVVVPLHIDAGAVPALGAAVHYLQGRSMGTTWSVKVVAAPRLDTAALHAHIQQSLDRVVAQMSTWDEASDLSRFNRASPGSWHTIAPQFAQVMACALDMAAASGGAFDPAAGALVNLWGFGPTHRHDEPGFRPPTPAAIAAARARGGWRDLHFERDTRRLQQPGGIELDFSAIAKGYGVDEVARCLRAQGFDGFLVELGGELRGEGVRPDGQPWWVELESPAGASAAAPRPTRVALHGLAVATSGDYRRWFTLDGRRLAHTIDPRSGEPVGHGLASVSVLHAECMRADALSTALTVLGPRDGMAQAREHGVAALFVTRRDDGGLEEAASPALLEMCA